MSSRRNSSGSSSTGSKPSLAAPPTQAPTTRPPTPPSMYGSGTGGGGSGGGGGGTLRKASSPYRTPAPPVSPPIAPNNYAPNYPIQAPSPASSVGSLRKSGYATGNMVSAGGQPPAQQAQLMRAMSGMGTPQPQMYDRDSMPPYISGQNTAFRFVQFILSVGGGCWLIFVDDILMLDAQSFYLN